MPSPRTTSGPIAQLSSVGQCTHGGCYTMAPRCQRARHNQVPHIQGVPHYKDVQQHYQQTQTAPVGSNLGLAVLGGKLCN